MHLHSDEGRARYQAFLPKYMEDGEAVAMACLDVLKAWAGKTDIDLPVAHHISDRMLQRLDGLTPHLGDLIQSRETPLWN